VCGRHGEDWAAGPMQKPSIIGSFNKWAAFSKNKLN